MYYVGKDLDKKYGVAIIMTKEMASKVERTVEINERMMGLTLRLNGGKVGLIQVYAPHQGRPREEKELFYEELQHLYDNINTENKIIMGDLNAHIGRDRQALEDVMGAWSVGERNAEGERLLDFAVRNGMSVMNTFYAHRDSHKWTWYRWNSNVEDYVDKSMIDMMITNNKHIFNDVKTVPSVSLDSDHRLLLAKLKIEKPKSPTSIIKQRYEVEKLKDEDVSTRFRQKIRDIKPAFEERQQTVHEEWQHFKSKIKKCAEEEIHIKTYRDTNKKKTIWWTEEVKTAVKSKTRAFRCWMKRRTNETRERYVAARRWAEEVKRREKRTAWERIGEDLRRDLIGTRKLIYKMAKRYRMNNNVQATSIKNRGGELLVEQEEINAAWGEYFSDLYNQNVIPIPEEPEILMEQNAEDPITREEVDDAIRKMKRGKSPGCDGLPAEIFKEGEDIKEWLWRVYSSAWNEEKIPEEWGQAIICPIHKKGDKTECHNYRGISLLSHAGKIYERILERRLRRRIEERILENQYGFRLG